MKAEHLLPAAAAQFLRGIFLLMGLSAGITGFAQVQFWSDEMFRLPAADRPVEQLTFHQKMQSKFLVKNTATFGLKGPVKSVKETVTLENNSELVIRYEFLENKLLTLYQVGDTLPALKESFSKMEKYSYQGSSLSQIQLYTGYPQHSSRTVHTFDQGGYLVQTTYDCFECETFSGSAALQSVFDYTQQYKWSPNRDAVSLKYKYKIVSDYYERFKDRTVSFASEKNNTKQAKPFWNETFPGISVVVKKDARGNITEHITLDRQIKNSMNIDTRLVYEYNDRDELTGISRYHTVYRGLVSSDWNLAHTFKIEYLGYDQNGNWLVKKVTGTDNSPDPSNPGETNIYTYRREIGYYE